MLESFSHSYFDDRHFEKQRLDKNLQSKYDGCKYKLSIYLPSLEETPRFNAIGIENIWGGNRKYTTITGEASQYGITDREGIGNFIFLLAAKLMYDLLKKKHAPDNAGFLHSREMERLYKKCSDVPPTIYGQLKRLRRESKGYLAKFLFAPDQMDHLICSYGKTGDRKGKEDLVWWLNVSPDDIEVKFSSYPDRKIPPDELIKYLEKLFPQKYLLSNAEIKDFCNSQDESNVDAQPSAKKVVRTAATEKTPAIPIPEDARIRQFKGKLRQQAIEHLAEKLYNKGVDDYIPLGMEIGLLNAKEKKDIEGDRHHNGRYGHNRNWQEFDHKQLKSLEEIYILSSETGSGKTTFLRNLQITLIDKTSHIPLFIDASDMEDMDFRNRNKNNFIKSIADLFDGYLDDGHERKFLTSYFDKIVFLIDGLDQIRGTGNEYKHLVDNLFAMIKTNLIITSRPFAAIEEESDYNVKFLRLKNFTEKDQVEYFRDTYSRAKELCRNCSDMLSVPMLAYMTRTLIAKGEDKGISNRAQLYSKFISHIFKNHIPETLVLSFDEMVEIRDILGEISYKAIAAEKPYWQKILYSFAKNCLQHRNKHINIETLLKSGLPDTLINECGGSDIYLYFSHQSFQEYSAAEYISESNDLIQKTLAEKWNPKWKEVIKFLVGIKGQEIIESILNEKDNLIHSKLFLTAELFQEVEATPTLRNKISQKIEELFACPSFNETNGIYYLLYVDDAKAVNRLSIRLEDIDAKVRMAAISALHGIRDRIHGEVVGKFVSRLMEIVLDKDEDSWVCQAAIDVLVELYNQIENNIAERFVNKLMEIAWNNEPGDRFRTIIALGNLYRRIGDNVTEELINKLVKIVLDKNEDAMVCSGAILALGRLNSRIDKKIATKSVNKIVKVVLNKDPHIFDNAINALERLENCIDDNLAKELVNKFMEIVFDKNENVGIRYGAVKALGKLHNRIQDEVARELINKLMEIAWNNDEKIGFRNATIQTIGRLGSQIDDNLARGLVNKLIKFVMDKGNESGDRYCAINILGKLENRIDDNLAKELVNTLVEIVLNKDEASWVCLGVTNVLGKLQSRIQNKIIEKFVVLQDDRAYVLLRTLYEHGRLEHLSILQ